MKEEKLSFVVTYFTTAEAMATERLCKALNIQGKLISAPRSVSADCGIAFATAPENRETLTSALQEKGIEVQGFHELFI